MPRRTIYFASARCFFFSAGSFLVLKPKFSLSIEPSTGAGVIAVELAQISRNGRFDG